MIKLMRTMRRKLLSENRFTRYLAYAVGEIVLVVAGILIALQLNSWSDQRKNKVLVAQYTENLIEDLVEDSTHIQAVLAGIAKDTALLAKFESRVRNSPYPLDTLCFIARYDYNFYIYGQFDFNNDTYSVLNSTGHIALFDKDIISELNVLSNQQDLALASTQQTFDSYRSNIHRYAQQYPVPFESNLITNGSVLADTIWNQISLVEHATQFNALVLAKGDSYRLALKSLPILADQINDLLEKLRE